MSANDCFICLKPLNDGTPTTVVGLGFTVHAACNEDDEDV